MKNQECVAVSNPMQILNAEKSRISYCQFLPNLNKDQTSLWKQGCDTALSQYNTSILKMNN